MDATVSGLAAGTVIPAGTCVDGTWDANYILPVGTTALRNVVEITLADRTKTFVARDSFEFPEVD